VIPNDASWMVVPVDQNTGESRPGYNLANLTAGTHARLSLADRLTPSDSSNGNEPQFVWDFAVRRMQPRSANVNDIVPPNGNALQVAIFIRRIDQRIRVWPVTVDSNTGLPTLDGQVGTGFAYSTPMTADVQIIPSTTGGRTDVVRLVGPDQLPGGVSAMTNARVFDVMSQRGQSFVDQFGHVYTVLGPNPDTGPLDIKLTTPIDPYFAAGLLVPLNVVFTPQVPATVILMKVTK
jgi:hypothetical protein